MMALSFTHYHKYAFLGVALDSLSSTGIVAFITIPSVFFGNCDFSLFITHFSPLPNIPWAVNLQTQPRKEAMYFTYHTTPLTSQLEI